MKRLNKINYLLIILVIIITFLVVYNLVKQQTAVQTGQIIKQTAVQTNKVCFKQRCFSVELAQTSVERERGLMFREKLNENSGMLFIFEDKGIYNFWMKNTLIALDIIWIDENKKVVYIKENALPCKESKCEIYKPNENTIYVLELNAGEVEKNNISIGDKINFI
ncbi:MAG: DUF192 domain-containing protein [Candidatus Pacearchaeota archaeon]|jgi:hypothetical protein